MDWFTPQTPGLARAEARSSSQVSLTGAGSTHLDHLLLLPQDVSRELDEMRSNQDLKWHPHGIFMQSGRT